MTLEAWLQWRWRRLLGDGPWMARHDLEGLGEGSEHGAGEGDVGGLELCSGVHGVCALYALTPGTTWWPCADFNEQVASDDVGKVGAKLG